jgi:hypothetical protein
MNIAAYHIATIRPGGAYFAPGGKAYTVNDRPRGTIAVDDAADGYRYLYRRPYGASVREVRRAIGAVFSGRLTGRWPVYTVEPR